MLSSEELMLREEVIDVEIDDDRDSKGSPSRTKTSTT